MTAAGTRRRGGGSRLADRPGSGRRRADGRSRRRCGRRRGGGRPSAVLILFGDGPDGPDLLLMQRSPFLRRHAGAARLPRRRDRRVRRGPVPAALREAAEETGRRSVGRAGARGAAGAVHPAQRVLGDPGPGLVASPGPGGTGRPGGDQLRGPGRDRGPGRPGQPADGPLPIRGGRASVPRRRHAGLGIHRHDRGPAARDRRLGAALGRRIGRGPPARGAARRGRRR